VERWIEEDPEIRPWFAWYPVEGHDKQQDARVTFWLESVERGRAIEFNRMSGTYQKTYEYFGVKK